MHHELTYTILPVTVHTSKLLFLICSMVMAGGLTIVGLFVAMLMGIQLRNFCSNRTTNERFGRKKLPIRSRSSISDFTERSDSTGSSLLSAMPPLLSEDIINDIGGMDENVGCCSTVRNFAAMCCNTQMPDQQEIFNRMVENKNSVTDSRMLASPPKIRQSERATSSINKSEVSIDLGESGTTLTKGYQPEQKRAHSQN